MKITAKKFAQLLKSSSLSAEGQHAVLRLLPNLTKKRIERLARVLSKDVHERKRLFEQADLKEKRTLLKMKVDLGKIKQED